MQGEWLSTVDPNAYDIKWYGSCVNGAASGLGLVVASPPMGKLYMVTLITPGSHDQVYYKHNLTDSSYFIGLSNDKGEEGKLLNLTSVNGYTAPLEGYYTKKSDTNIQYTLLRNQIDGSAMYVKRYPSGKAISFISTNDYTNKIAQGIKIVSSDRVLFEGAKMSDGRTITLANGRYEDAESINTFITNELNGVDNKLASSPAAYYQALPKIDKVKATLCKRSDSEDINEFCNDMPYSYLKDEFERAAMTFRNQQQSRLANAEAQRMAAIRQQQIQQNNLDALNASFAQLNQTAQQLQRNALQSSQSYTQPSVSVPVQNRTNIYRCQDLSNMTYCNQLR